MSRHNYLDKILTKEILEKSYSELKSLKAVARKLNVDPTSIKKYMNIYGLYFKPQIRYDCDHNFFSKDYEESFYLAGFIAADGCIKNRKNKSGNITHELYISLSKKDKTFLNILRETMKAENPIKDFLIKNSKRNQKWNDVWRSEFTIVSKTMCNDLSRFNIKPRKSLVYFLPEWMKTHPLKHHFIRGYSDGDGSFYIPKTNRNTKQIHFALRGTIEFLKEIKNIIDIECGLYTKYKNIRISNGQGILEYGGNNIVSNIAKYIYKNSNIYLSRKKEIINSIIEI